MTRVYVGNLEEGCSKRELEREMEGFGSLRDVWVARNPPGFAFVVFEDRRDAESAVRHLDGRRICGGHGRVRVEIARGPTRGGRAARLGLKEKCYECGRVGHFARDCTRGPAQRRSRSRSPKRRHSRSRSYSPRRRTRSKSRSHSRSRSYSRSRSHSKEAKSDSEKEERQVRRSSEKTGDQESDQDQSRNGGDADENDQDDEGSDDEIQQKESEDN